MEKDIKLTPASKIVEMTKAFPPQEVNSRPVVYDQVIVDASSKADAKAGRPDPAHID